MTIRDELLQIKGSDDLLTAEAVVTWARAHKGSALYKAPEFCGWDLKKSAYQHWLLAARNLIAIHVRFEGGERRLVSLSIDRSKPGGGYRDVSDVVKNKDLYHVMLNDALGELQRVQSKYQNLKELNPVWQQVEKIRAREERRKAA